MHLSLYIYVPYVNLCNKYKECCDILATIPIVDGSLATSFNVGCAAVSSINLGRSYRQKGLDYPIRKNYQYNKIRKSFSPSEICEIEKLLKTELSIRKIAERFETCFTTIADINNGQIKKYHKENIKYPIRKIF